MVSKQVITGMALAATLVAMPALAGQDQQQRHREESRQRAEQSHRAQPPARAQSRDRAVPRVGPAPRTYEQRRDQREWNDARRNGRYDGRRYQAPRQYDRRVYRAPYYGPRSYRVAPRVIRPSIVTVVPYRPYVYRPSWSLGVLYGSDGYYPYGYTPREYYDPIPGRAYGGLRITDMPRDAQVFADGYYVGIVNDFDGIFQHLNLTAGPHHIEIQLPGGYDAPVAFDVFIEAGRTTTYRAAY
jgi:hypothetical protein